MKKCLVHIGVYDRYEGLIVDNVIYFESSKSELSLITEDRETGSLTYEVVPIKNSKVDLATMKDMEMYLYNGDDMPVKFSIDGKWGLVDVLTGEIIIEAIWDFIGYINNGFIPVGLGGFNVIKHQYEDYLIGGKFGYINERGKVVIPLEYEKVSEKSHNGYFIVFRDDKSLIINKDNIIQDNLTEEEISEIEKYINSEWNEDK